MLLSTQLYRKVLRALELNTLWMECTTRVKRVAETLFSCRQNVEHLTAEREPRFGTKSLCQHVVAA